jgi:hypothetical protein
MTTLFIAIPPRFNVVYTKKTQPLTNRCGSGRRTALPQKGRERLLLLLELEKNFLPQQQDSMQAHFMFCWTRKASS